MLQAIHEKQGSVTIIKLSGYLDENTNLAKTIGDVSGAVQINCKGITRINSLGVKMWIRFFSELAEKKIPFSFDEFGVVLVEQLNLISNFHCGGKINSVAVPFICTACSTTLVGSLKTEEIARLKGGLPQVTCPKCGGKAEIDDDPNEYFAFVRYLKA